MDTIMDAARERSGDVKQVFEQHLERRSDKLDERATTLMELAVALLAGIEDEAHNNEQLHTDIEQFLTEQAA